MYENETFEEIMDRMLARLPEDIDKREGSVAYDMLAPKAIELAMAYGQLDLVLDLGFPETTYGEFLDRKAYEAGLTRKPSEYAVGTVTITGDYNEEVPAGTIVYTDSGIRFLTDTAVIIPASGSVNVTVTAEVAGNSGNVAIGAITNVELDGMGCTNAAATSGGVDEESDEELLARYKQKITSPGISGNASHYKQWALEVDGVGDARVIPIWNGPGTVKVILVNGDKRKVSAEVVTRAKNYIETQRPVGAAVTVESATELTIAVTANIEIEDDFQLASVKTDIEKAISEYFTEIAFVDNQYVRYSSIGNAILSVDGVVDYNTLKINNGTTNITLTNTQVPVLGTVTLTEV